MMMEEEFGFLWSQMAATVDRIFDSYRQQDEIPATLPAQSPVLAALIAASVLRPYPEFFDPVITCNTTRPIRSSPITAPPPSRVRPETNQTHSSKTPSSLADDAPRSDHCFPFPQYREDDAHRRLTAYYAAFTTRVSVSVRLVSDGEEEHSRTAASIREEEDAPDNYDDVGDSCVVDGERVIAPQISIEDDGELSSAALPSGYGLTHQVGPLIILK
ncbi:hypothetical protein OROHE_018670 [Orobanche hederae]